VRGEGCKLRGAGCMVLLFFLYCIIITRFVLFHMSGYRDLEIYRLAFDLAVKVHRATFLLPKFELYEQGSQIRRSTKSVKDQIAEGYGSRRYKADFIKFLVYSHASNDEALSQLDMIIILYPEITEFSPLLGEYEILGRKINSYIDYVDNNWRT